MKTDSFKAGEGEVHAAMARLTAAIKERLCGMAKTLKALRLGRHDRPDRIHTGWPEVVRAAAESYGYDEARPGPALPSPGEIDLAERAIQWLWWLTDEQRKLVVARAFGLTWRRLEGEDGRSRETLRKIHESAIEEIARRLLEAQDT